MGKRSLMTVQKKRLNNQRNKKGECQSVVQVKKTEGPTAKEKDLHEPGATPKSKRLKELN